MPVNKVVLLACGSFNPPTNMHLRMFELARDHLNRLGQEVIGGIISPVHDAYGKKDLVSATHRLQMLKYALDGTDWLKISSWETRQEGWTQTRKCIEYHQKNLFFKLFGDTPVMHDQKVDSLRLRNFTSNSENHINAASCNKTNYQCNNINEEDFSWLPDDVRNNQTGPVKVKLLCGADLLESFGTPGLWADEDIEAIVGHHGLVVITRQNTNPLLFIYNSDVLTKYMANITIVTEWITNEVSSTKIRKALRRSESVKYLIPDRVIQYIYKHKLYGAQDVKYLFPPTNNSVFLTPSPSDMVMETPSPTNNRCLVICDNEFFRPSNAHRLSIDTVDSLTKSNIKNIPKKHPGQAMKIITTSPGQHKVVTETSKEASLERPACLL